MILPCTITAVFDVEDADADHRKRFENTLKEMSEAENLGKAIKFDLGYSNIDFEWVWGLGIEMFEKNELLLFMNEY